MSQDRNTYIENNDFNESLNNYLEKIVPLGTENVSVFACVQRVTYNAVFAKQCDPSYNCAAMDGIAVFSENTLSADESTPLVLRDGDYEYVNTGNAIKSCFDSVIKIEDVVVLNDGNVKIFSPSRPYQHIRTIGESVTATEMIVPSYHKIRPYDLGAIIASGNEIVSVFKKPIVGIIPTGGEMVENPNELAVGKLMESNSRVFSAMTTETGGEPKRYGIVEDDIESLLAAIKKAADECDIIVVCAGSSAGTKDITKKAIETLGTVQTHGLAVKPGKPTILGFIGEKPVIGVPGYPVSAYLIFEKVVKAVIAKMAGQSQTAKHTVTATLTKRLTSEFKNEEYVRAALGYIDGRLYATPLERGAAAVMSMVKAAGLIKIERNVEGIEEGESVEVELMKPLDEIKRTLSVVGSHDPVLDFINDKILLSSAHVGSFSGLLAIMSNAAHIAPIHLLDAASGQYNVPYVKKYFAPNSMAIIKGLKRTQGILVPKGNPKKICDLEKLKDKSIRFANRQNGSGTRILLDYLLKKLDIKGEEINGYEKEYSTHLLVASAVKNGVCDCGLAVKSAANIMGLDFLPVGDESYDFLVPVKFLKDDRVKAFIECIKSDDFKAKTESLGGYAFDGIGDIEVVK